eukprot:scaffold4161_cov101-Isochrysis_galbana.AAC.9
MTGCEGASNTCRLAQEQRQRPRTTRPFLSPEQICRSSSTGQCAVWPRTWSSDLCRHLPIWLMTHEWAATR